MQDSYSQIQFLAANYSKLQGLKEASPGLFDASIGICAMDNPGNLGIPILLAGKAKSDVNTL